MVDIWVYKEDGTVQCGGKEITLDEMRKQLATAIGDREILSQEKRQLPGLYPEQCGLPNGRVNAYQITAKGLWILFRGFLGSLGFKVWMFPDPKTGAPFDNPVPWPFLTLFQGDRHDFAAGGEAKEQTTALINIAAALTQVGQTPTMLSEVIGRAVRFYKTGDSLTMDYRPQRVNIEHAEGAIVRIWFG